jgi:membrane protein YdbS with pleckstrin-like domain
MIPEKRFAYSQLTKAIPLGLFMGFFGILIDFLIPTLIIMPILTCFYAYLHARSYSFNITKKSITVQGGVFFKGKTALAMNTIQTFGVSQGFVERIFDLHTVTIFATSDGIVLPGLSSDTVTELRKLLKTRKHKIVRVHKTLEKQETSRKILSHSKWTTLPHITLWYLTIKNLYMLMFIWFVYTIPTILLMFITPFWLPLILYIFSIPTTSFIFATIEYRRSRYKLTKDTIILQSGTITVAEGSVPISKIQSAIVQTTLISRIFGLALLGVESEGAVVTIDGISEKDALALLQVFFLK